MKNYKVKVATEAESKEAKDLFEQLGFRNCHTKRFGMVYVLNGNIKTDLFRHWDYYTNLGCKEITIRQLRELVAQSKPKVREYLVKCVEAGNYFLTENHSNFVGAIEVPEGATLLTKDIGGYLTFWNGDLSMNVGESGWSSPGEDNGVLSFDEYKDYGYATLWSRESIQEQGLISGADAKLAWASGEDVECKTLCEWLCIFGDMPVSIFDRKDAKFRLKPSTITLSLEIPAPFEPNVGEFFYVLDPTAVGGYSKIHITDQKRIDDYAKLGAWRTEEEIKQVVVALRGAIKCQ